MSPRAINDIGPYEFRFFATDRNEPPHVHVRREKLVAKLWLDPVAVALNQGYREHELNKIERLVVENRTPLLEAWHEFFGD